MRTVTCLFCERDGEEAVEDILPNWYARRTRRRAVLAGDNAPYWHGGTFDVRPGEPGRPTLGRRHQTAAIFKLEGVCISCNGTWMSHLEDVVSRLATPLLDGAATHLSPGDLTALARWAQLKWISIAALGDRAPHLVNRAVSLFRSDAPLSDVQVFLGKNGDALAPVRAHFLLGSGRASTPATGGFDYAKLAINLDHLSVVVAGSESPVGTLPPFFARQGARLQQSCPPPGPAGLDWPPQRELDKRWCELNL